MEKLKNLNKLWRTSTTSYIYSAERVINKETQTEDYTEAYDEEEEEESFFELELIMSRAKENNGMHLTSKEANTTNSNSNAGRRVVPLEPALKPHPHSPISILKSAPKFKVSLFRKHTDLKLKPNPKTKSDKEDDFNPKATTPTISTLISQNCRSPVSKPHKPSITKPDKLHSDSSNRFSNNVMHKYLKLKLIKPFHLKAAKRSASVNTSNTKSKMFDLRECSVSSTSSASSGLRVACKQLGKSRSASSMASGCSRRDESLMVVEHDDGGIQSAILHCKRSFNLSRDSSVHSRSSSDSRDQEQQVT